MVCARDLVIRVDKKMRVRRDARNRYLVMTRFYQYHAMLRGTGGRSRRSIVRIANAHGGTLHRHVFSDAGEEVNLVTIGLDAMPTLDELIREAVVLLSAQDSTTRPLG